MSGRLLVLGRTGQLARALADASAVRFEETICAGRERADLSVPGDAARLVAALAPDTVINAAAWTAVDAAEADEDAAWRINAQAAGEVAEAARKIGARFIQVSTDYVFGGDGRRGPFSEDAEPAPANAYGRTKRAGEELVLQAHPEAAVVRTSAVFSGRGADFPSAMWRLAGEHPHIDVVDDQLTGPTHAGDLAEALLTLSAVKGAAGVFHFSGEPHVSWAQFAVSALAISTACGGPDADIRPVNSALFPRPAARPADSRLGGRRLAEAAGLEPAGWGDGLSAAYDTWRRTR